MRRDRFCGIRPESGRGGTSGSIVCRFVRRIFDTNFYETEGSSSRSEGTGTGTGNQGDLAGTPEGSHEGTGTGTDGNSASLSGRSLVGGLPSPDYRAKDQGRVVIEIVVDQQGRVTSAAYRAKGSTTQNSVLVNAALKAARGARFNVDESAPLSQTGTITYNFRMQ